MTVNPITRPCRRKIKDDSNAAWSDVRGGVRGWKRDRFTVRIVGRLRQCLGPAFSRSDRTHWWQSAHKNTAKLQNVPPSSSHGSQRIRFHTFKAWGMFCFKREAFPIHPVKHLSPHTWRRIALKWTIRWNQNSLCLFKGSNPTSSPSTIFVCETQRDRESVGHVNSLRSATEICLVWLLCELCFMYLHYWQWKSTCETFKNNESILSISFLTESNQYLIWQLFAFKLLLYQFLSCFLR